MGHKKKITGYYVEVNPKRLGDFGICSMSDSLIEPDEDRRMEEYKQRCEEMVDQIKRHVNNVGVDVVEQTVRYTKSMSKTNKQPLRCKFGFHKWSKWEQEEVKEVISLLYTTKQKALIQKRYCLLCNMMSVRTV